MSSKFTEEELKYLSIFVEESAIKPHNIERISLTNCYDTFIVTNDGVDITICFNYSEFYGLWFNYLGQITINGYCIDTKSLLGSDYDYASKVGLLSLLRDYIFSKNDVVISRDALTWKEEFRLEDIIR